MKPTVSVGAVWESLALSGTQALSGTCRELMGRTITDQLNAIASKLAKLMQS